MDDAAHNPALVIECTCTYVHATGEWKKPQPPKPECAKHPGR